MLSYRKTLRKQLTLGGMVWQQLEKDLAKVTTQNAGHLHEFLQLIGDSGRRPSKKHQQEPWSSLYKQQLLGV